MKRRILTGLLLAIFALSIAVPVLADYWAYLTIEESDGNDYTNLPVTCFRNITQLADYDIITSTGLDTRVLTGDGGPLPHMLAEDRIMTVTDLAADEKKTLIFYTGATSLSSFPIIPGYDGYITTPDDEELEHAYVMELLVDGYFDSSAGADKNVCYKEDAYKMNISGANTIKVAQLEAGDVEQWEMHYSSLTSGEHTIYVSSDGMQGSLYVDDFDVAKDTVTLWDSGTSTLVNDAETSAARDGIIYRRTTFYSDGKYWAFYTVNDGNIYWRTSADGSSWSAEQSEAGDGGDTCEAVALAFRNDYVHIIYTSVGNPNRIMYRRGTPHSNNSSITWSAVWQEAATGSYIREYNTIGVDDDDYPLLGYSVDTGVSSIQYARWASTNDGTWTTASTKTVNTGQKQVFVVSYPNSDDMYVLYRDTQLSGYYWTGSAWAGTYDTISTGYNQGFGAVADNDNNLYVAWSSSPTTVQMRIRYSTGVWSDISTVTTTAGGYYAAASYNPYTGHVYIFYLDSGDDVTVICWNGEDWIGPYEIFDPGLYNDDGYVSQPSESGMHHGFTYHRTAAPISTGFGDLAFPYEWNDNSNDWIWMQNNVMPYADSILMAVDGVTHLEYEPDGIIEDSILPDLSENSDNDGIITWGDNPEGVAASLSTFSDDDEGESTPVVVPPGEAGFTDIVGPTGQPGWTGSLPTLASNPFYPLVAAISEFTNIPVGLIWIIGATLLLILAMVVTVWKVPHLIVTALVGGGLSAFWFAMGIYPFWVMFIFAIMALAIIVGERSPTV